MVAVVGDSTAAFTMPALRQLAEEDGGGFRVVDLARFACPFTALDMHFDGGSSCSAFKETLTGRLAALQPDLLVVMNTSSRVEGASRPVSDRDWAAGVGELIDRVRRSVGQVAIALPNPPGPDLRSCAVQNGSPAACATRPAAGRAGVYRRLDAVTVVDTALVWCAGNRCPAVIGDDLVRVDSVHVTPEAAVAAADALRVAFRDAGVPLGPEHQ